MNTPRRWHLLIKNISPPNLDFNYIKSVSVVSILGEYKGYSEKEFRDIVNSVYNNEYDEIVNIVYVPNIRKIRKEVQDVVEPLFQKYFSTRPVS